MQSDLWWCKHILYGAKATPVSEKSPPSKTIDPIYFIQFKSKVVPISRHNTKKSNFIKIREGVQSFWPVHLHFNFLPIWPIFNYGPQHFVRCSPYWQNTRLIWILFIWFKWTLFWWASGLEAILNHVHWRPGAVGPDLPDFKVIIELKVENSLVEKIIVYPGHIQTAVRFFSWKE